MVISVVPLRGRPFVCSYKGSAHWSDGAWKGTLLLWRHYQYGRANSHILASSWSHLGATWSRLGAVLRPPWGLLGPSWGLLGPSWGHLGPCLAIVGHLLAILGPTWGHLEQVLDKCWQVVASAGKCWHGGGTALANAGRPGGMRGAVRLRQKLSEFDRF